MPTFRNIEAAREYFNGDRFAVENGVTLDALGDDWATCSMPIEPRHMNANGGVMGGAIFTLADFAGAVASNNVYRPTVTQQVSVNLLSNSRGSRLYATARCRRDGRTSCVYCVDVKDDLGRDIALVVATGYKVPQARD